MHELVIAAEDPRTPDIRALLERHLEFAQATTPIEHVHALELDGLLDPAVTLYALRSGGRVLGIGALKQLEPGHVEIKSMHTAASVRRRGVARTILGHLLQVAVERGANRVSLETGTMEAFAPARSLYTNAGFVSCEPFGDYAPSPSNTFMTLMLGAGRVGSSDPADRDLWHM